MSRKIVRACGLTLINGITCTIVHVRVMCFHCTCSTHGIGRVDLIVGDRMEDKESGGGGGGERKVNQQPVRQQPRNRRKNVVNRARDWALKRRQQLAKERQERGDGQRRK